MLESPTPRRQSVPLLDLKRVRLLADEEASPLPLAPSAAPASLSGPIAIVASQFCERIAFYGISAVLVSYAIRALRFTAGEAATLLLVWQGVCYTSPLLSSWVADHVLGRFATILWWSLPYALGLAALTVSALSPVLADHPAISLALAYAALALVALGQVQVNVITFGADQFDSVPSSSSSSSTPSSSSSSSSSASTAQQSYFNWFFFAINAGALIAFTAVAYLAQEVSLVLGFALPLLALLAHVGAFLFGRRWYRRLAPSPSQSILLDALLLLVRLARSPASPSAAAGPWWRRALSLRSLSGARVYSRGQLRALVRFVHSLPVQLTFVVFWCIWSQTSSVFVAQSTVLNLRVCDLFSVPVAGLNVFNTAAIVLLTPLFDRLLYPWLRRLHVDFSALRRIGAGYALVVLAVLYAAVLERYRRSLVAEGHVVRQSIGLDAAQQAVHVDAADLSILAQAPAFALVGVGEILAAISGTEYSYAALPLSLRSTAIAIFWTTSALGTFLGALLVAMVTALWQWFTPDLNQAQLDKYFLLLAALGALNLLALVLVTRFVPDMPEDASSDDDSDDDSDDSLHKDADSLHETHVDKLSSDSAGSASASAADSDAELIALDT